MKKNYESISRSVENIQIGSNSFDWNFIIVFVKKNLEFNE